MMNTERRTWAVVDESADREGFCCLAVREEESLRLIADLADEPLDYPQCVERSWEEARLLAAAPVLHEVCRELIRYHEKMDASDNVYEYGFPADLVTRLYDAVAAAEGRIETSYGGVVEDDE
ncbi:MAG TPA: hypothetical protein DEB39_06565 [Planctomycetaceae bacterium]|nr:hypothetical protein [Planctomycetaceae bacterium]